MSSDARARTARALASLATLALFAVAIAGCKDKVPPPKPVQTPPKAVELRPGILVFTARGGIWKLDKGGQPELVLDGQYWFPVLNAEGDKIAYWEDRGGTMALFIMNLISRETMEVGEWFTLLAHGRNMNLRNAPCWHPGKDKDVLFFADGRQIWRVNGDGTGLETVYEHRDGGCYSVAVAPDGDQFAFVNVGPASQNLWTYSIEAQHAMPITDYSNQDGMVGAPAWSPLDHRIAYVFYKGEEANIRLISPQGGSKEELTKQGYTNSPQWGVLGKNLVVCSGTKNRLRWQIILMEAETGKFIDPALTDIESGAFAPSITGDWQSE